MKPKQLAERIGNIDSRLVQQAEQVPNYGRRRRKDVLRRFLTVAAALVLMVSSFTAGALAFSQEPAEQEMIELTDLHLTLLLPENWQGKYAVTRTEAGDYVVYCPEIREASIALAREEFGELWQEEWAEDPFYGGVLFYIVLWREQLTEEQFNAGGEWDFTACRYLMSTREGTYILYYASDVQFTAETEALYSQLASGIRDIRIIVDNALAD